MAEGRRDLRRRSVASVRPNPIGNPIRFISPPLSLLHPFACLPASFLLPGEHVRSFVRSILPKEQDGETEEAAERGGKREPRLRGEEGRRDRAIPSLRPSLRRSDRSAIQPTVMASGCRPTDQRRQQQSVQFPLCLGRSGLPPSLSPSSSFFASKSDAADASIGFILAVSGRRLIAVSSIRVETWRTASSALCVHKY